MSGALRVFRAEWHRVLHGLSLWVAAAFLVVVPALRVFGAAVAHSTEQANALANALADGKELPELVPGNAYAPLTDAWSTGVVLGALLLLVSACISLAHDRERGVLRLATTRSVTRLGLVGGRALLGLPMVLGVLVITGLSAALTAGLLFEFGPLVEYEYEIASSAELRVELLRSGLAALPPLYALWCFGLLISSLARGAILAVASGLLLYLGFDLFKELLGEARYWVFASFAPSFVDSSYLDVMTRIARGFSDAVFPEELFRLNMILPWPEAALLLACTGLVLSRRTL